MNPWLDAIVTGLIVVACFLVIAAVMVLSPESFQQ